MDAYSGPQPNLIGPIMRCTAEKIAKQKVVIGHTISDKIFSWMQTLYKDYIEDKKIFIFVLLLIIGFLIYRYYNKASKVETLISYEKPPRNYYTGTHNPYEHAQDTDIPNPLGFKNDFNTTTKDFLEQSTDLNQQNLADYLASLEKAEKDMIERI